MTDKDSPTPEVVPQEPRFTNSDETAYLLDCVIEECAEVIQRATKAKRFGVLEVQPEQLLTNQERIVGELNDLIGATNLLLCKSSWQDAKAIKAKEDKVLTFMRYSKECGILK